MEEAFSAASKPPARPSGAPPRPAGARGPEVRAGPSAPAWAGSASAFARSRAVPLAPRRDRFPRPFVVAAGDEPQGAGRGQVTHLEVRLRHVLRCGGGRRDAVPGAPCLPGALVSLVGAPSLGCAGVRLELAPHLVEQKELGVREAIYEVRFDALRYAVCDEDRPCLGGH